jgi:hypothetical protein
MGLLGRTGEAGEEMNQELRLWASDRKYTSYFSKMDNYQECRNLIIGHCSQTYWMTVWRAPSPTVGRYWRCKDDWQWPLPRVLLWLQWCHI